MSTAVHNIKTIFRQKLSSLQTIAGLDFHILVTLIFRGWAVIAGGATVVILPLWLSPIEQGYYFTFASVLALQIFFELGLNQIVMQFVSHEVAHLTEKSDGSLIGNELHLGRLSSLARLINRWYGIAALLFAVIGVVTGVAFFGHKGTEPMTEWLDIWVVLVGATAVNLWLSPGLAVMEGCGKVGQVARLRLVQSVLGYACLWAALIAGMGLWAAIALPVVSAICTAYWLKKYGNTLQWFSRQAVDFNNQLSWRKDVLPLQWRIALSWMSGYLIFNLFTPVVFSSQGAVEAGRLGLALTVFSTITTIGMSWVNAKAPNFTMYIARGERSELNILFNTLFIRSTIVIAITATSVVGVVWYLNQIGLPQISRIASPDVLAVLGITTVVNSIIFAMAIYMRAHRKEPMVAQSVTVSLMIACAIYWTSKSAIFVMMLSYAIITLFISLPWTIFLYFQYKKIGK